MPRGIRCGNPVRILSVALLTLLFAGGASVWAQGLDFKVPEFYFNNNNTQFDSGTTPYAEINNFQRSLYPGLRARLFWKDEVDRRAHTVAARGPDGPDRCYIFNAIVLRIRTTVSRIYLDGIPRTGGEWIVIFETGQWTKGPIKLSSRAVDEYFRRGFRFSTEEPKEVWNPLILVAVLFPQHFAQKAAEQQKREEERQKHQTAAQEEALARLADDPQCVWFRTASRNFLVAEKKPCGGCSPEETQRAEIAAQWVSQVMVWVR